MKKTPRATGWEAVPRGEYAAWFVRCANANGRDASANRDDGATMRQAPSGNGGAAGVPNTPAPKRTRHDATPNGRRSKHEPGLVRW